jgi:hypothetical protein
MFSSALGLACRAHRNMADYEVLELAVSTLMDLQ